MEEKTKIKVKINKMEMNILKIIYEKYYKKFTKDELMHLTLALLYDKTNEDFTEIERYLEEALKIIKEKW